MVNMNRHDTKRIEKKRVSIEVDKGDIKVIKRAKIEAIKDGITLRQFILFAIREKLSRRA